MMKSFFSILLMLGLLSSTAAWAWESSSHTLDKASPHQWRLIDTLDTGNLYVDSSSIKAVKGKTVWQAAIKQDVTASATQSKDVWFHCKKQQFIEKAYLEFADGRTLSGQRDTNGWRKWEPVSSNPAMQAAFNWVCLHKQ